MAFEAMFQPIQIGKLTIRNRIVSSPHGWWSSVNLSTDRIIPHFQNLADAMHKHGAKIMIQITHMGRRSRWDGFDWPTLMSPSGIREPVHRATCKTIEPE